MRRTSQSQPTAEENVGRRVFNEPFVCLLFSCCLARNEIPDPPGWSSKSGHCFPRRQTRKCGRTGFRREQQQQQQQQPKEPKRNVRRSIGRHLASNHLAGPPHLLEWPWSGLPLDAVRSRNERRPLIIFSLFFFFIIIYFYFFFRSISRPRLAEIDHYRPLSRRTGPRPRSSRQAPAGCIRLGASRITEMRSSEMELNVPPGKKKTSEWEKKTCTECSPCWFFLFRFTSNGCVALTFGSRLTLKKEAYWFHRSSADQSHARSSGQWNVDPAVIFVNIVQHRSQRKKKKATAARRPKRPTLAWSGRGSPV